MFRGCLILTQPTYPYQSMKKSKISKYIKLRRKTRRLEIVKLLGNKCVQCTAQTDLQCDHIVPGSKDFNLSGCNLDKPWIHILQEAKKCQLLCKECHTLKTQNCYENIGGWNLGISRSKKVPSHGTPARYSAFGCRCIKCREAKRKYRLNKITYSGKDAVVRTTERISKQLLAKKKSNALKQDGAKIHAMLSASSRFHKQIDICLDNLLQNKGKSSNYHACPCGEPITRRSTKYCSEVCRQTYMKPKPSKRPSKETLISVIKTMSFVKAGIHFGVSDTSIRKWIKHYSLK